MTLDSNNRGYLARHLAQGTAVLFTGAGFSTGCENQLGTSVPMASSLREDIWRIAFGTAQSLVVS
jgi:hypothetical protein